MVLSHISAAVTMKIKSVLSSWTLAGAGAFMALILALTQALGVDFTRDEAFSDDILVQVNGISISRADYQLALEGLRKGRRTELSRDDKSRALQILIDEELLLQRAEQIGLLQSDRTVRKAIINAVLNVTMAKADPLPSDTILKAWYDDNLAHFTPQAQIRLVAAKAGSIAAAAAFTQKIQSGSFTEAAYNTPDIAPLPLPTSYLPQKVVISELGPDVARLLAKLGTGDIAGPLGKDRLFVWIIDHRKAITPSFEVAKDQIQRAWLRKSQEKQVQNLLEQLRTEADLVGLLALAESP